MRQSYRQLRMASWLQARTYDTDIRCTSNLIQTNHHALSDQCPGDRVVDVEVAGRCEVIEQLRNNLRFNKAVSKSVTSMMKRLHEDSNVLFLRFMASFESVAGS